MCEPKPGNRCSNHQKRTFESKIISLESQHNVNMPLETKLKTFGKELAELNATPYGQNVLDERIMQTQNAGERTRLQKQKDAGMELREARKVALANNGEEVQPEPVSFEGMRAFTNIKDDYAWHNARIAKEEFVRTTRQKKRAAKDPSAPQLTREEAQQLEDLRRAENKDKEVQAQRKALRRETRDKARNFSSVISLSRYSGYQVANHNPEQPYWKNAMELRTRHLNNMDYEAKQKWGEDFKQEIVRLASEERQKPEFQHSLRKPELSMKEKISSFFTNLPKIVEDK
jgi:hypothetical protein